MTRILVQRGSAGSSSSNSNRTSLPGSSTATPQPQTAPFPPISVSKDEESESEVHEQVTVDDRLDCCGGGDSRASENAELLLESSHADRSDSMSDEFVDSEKAVNENFLSQEGLEGPMISDGSVAENEGSSCCPVPMIAGSSYPPPPPVPPPKPSSVNSNTRRLSPGSPNAVRNMPSRRTRAWPVVSTRSSPSGSRPSSPRSHGDVEGYNSADEQNPCFSFAYDDAEREHQFEIDIWRVKGLQVKRMLEDGNCLFRAIADQVYGDSESFDLTRQLCIDYMEQERDHFSQFITEGFTSYCMRKRRDKVYGNNAEIQALSEIFNRPIHIYSYSTEPINIFHKGYNTDMPPIRLSYHHGNHYNSLVDPRRLTIGAGLGFSCLQGRDINKDEVKAAIKAQQDQQIDKALVAEGRFYSDMELTEKEIECMVMEASRAEYDKMQQMGSGGAEPSSSGGKGSVESSSSCMQALLSMGFSYAQAREACGIFGEDVDSMVCYLLETESNSRRKGKAAE